MRSEAIILIVSDVHYASAGERQRPDYEARVVVNPLLRGTVRAYRHYIWKRDPFAHNHLLDGFMEDAGTPDLVVANGDYCCDTAFVGVSDPAARESARECLDRLRERFGNRLRCVLGDHELGKLSLLGSQGGLRLESLRVARSELGVNPLWRYEFGRHVLIGVTSSLLALPVLEPETLPEERAEWRAERELHFDEVRRAFEALTKEQRVILFCHDPTALPFLVRDPVVRERLRQVELTVIGHLHSNLIFWNARWLAGMPVIRFLGNAVRRMSSALREARHWRPLNVRLCPALSGVELLNDGGYGRIAIQLEGGSPPRYEVRRLRPTHRHDPGLGDAVERGA
jgi:hypothetical protein